MGIRWNSLRAAVSVYLKMEDTWNGRFNQGSHDYYVLVIEHSIHGHSPLLTGKITYFHRPTHTKTAVELLEAIPSDILASPSPFPSIPHLRVTEGGQRWDATVGAPKGCDGPHRCLTGTPVICSRWNTHEEFRWDAKGGHIRLHSWRFTLLTVMISYTYTYWNHEEVKPLDPHELYKSNIRSHSLIFIFNSDDTLHRKLHPL